MEVFEISIFEPLLKTALQQKHEKMHHFCNKDKVRDCQAVCVTWLPWPDSQESFSYLKF